MRKMKILALVLVTLAGNVTQALAQDGSYFPGPTDYSKLAAALASRGPLVTERLLETGATTLAQSTGTSQPPNREPWVHRHLVLVGTLAGIGTGGVIAANVHRGEPAIIAGGAAAGALGGLIASTIHDAGQGRPIGPKTKFALVAGAIGAGVALLLLLQGLVDCTH